MHLERYGGKNMAKVVTSTYWVGFSYSTPVVLGIIGIDDVLVHHNVWGPTTGGHINILTRGLSRKILSREQFAWVVGVLDSDSPLEQKVADILVFLSHDDGQG